jgi:hypothetical protein
LKYRYVIRRQATIDQSGTRALQWAMRALLAAPLLAALAVPAAHAAPGFEAFPTDHVFRALLADPAEPRIFMSRLEVKRDAGKFSAALVGVGYDFGLLRRRSDNPAYGWQLSVFGSIDSLFNLDLPGDALVNTDYRVGVPLTWRNGDLSMRARVLHQSSHLGDELILGGNAPARIGLSFEALDLLLAWELDGLRLYGGGSRIFSSSTGAYEGSTLHAGFDYISLPVLYGQRLAVGLDVKWLEPANWRSGVSAKAGLMLGRHSLAQRGVSLLLVAYDGFAPFGQFFVEDVRYWGASIQLEF